MSFNCGTNIKNENLDWYVINNTKPVNHRIDLDVLIMELLYRC